MGLQRVGHDWETSLSLSLSTSVQDQSMPWTNKLETHLENSELILFLDKSYLPKEKKIIKLDMWKQISTHS